nr:LysM peptidoglycan-binding domain-containing protein [Clostridia bacterium]
ECAASEPITLLRDVYSTERAVTTVPESLTLTGLERAYTTNFTVNASALRSEIGAADAERALDADVRVVINDCRRDRERMKLILEGSADITVITARRSEDGMNDCMSHSFTTPVKCELDSNVTDDPDNFRYRCVSSVTMVRPRLDTNGLYCDFEVALALFAMSRESVTAVGSAHPDETAADSINDGASMILCCPTADETLWDIAKRYRTTMAAISEANSFTEPECHSQYRVKSKHNILLIPCRAKTVMPATGA